MKYSFMSFSCPELDAKELVVAARRYGYGGVSPRTDSKHAHGMELTAGKAERSRIRKEFETGGIEIACIATSCCYVIPEDKEMQEEKTRQYIKLASDLGCAKIRVFGGFLKGRLTKEKAMGQLVESLLAVADFAGREKVRVCFETHDDWSDPADVAEVMQRVNHEWIAVNWDIMHPVRLRLSTMENAFETLKPWIQHVHIHDCAGYGDDIVFTPVGKGIIDHKLALQLLMGLGRELFLEFEWFNMGPCEKHLPEELATMKKYESNLTKKEIL